MAVAGGSRGPINGYRPALMAGGCDVVIGRDSPGPSDGVDPAGRSRGEWTPGGPCRPAVCARLNVCPITDIMSTYVCAVRPDDATHAYVTHCPTEEPNSRRDLQKRQLDGAQRSQGRAVKCAGAQAPRARTAGLAAAAVFERHRGPGVLGRPLVRRGPGYGRSAQTWPWGHQLAIGPWTGRRASHLAIAPSIGR